jgi:hypothetical protein
MAFKGEIKIKDPYKSPAKQTASTIGPMIQLGMGLIEGFGALNQKSDLEDMVDKNQERYDAERQAYLDMDITNPYAGMKNYFAGMENTMEDLTINQQEANFMRRQQQQSQANIMQQLRGAAGGSGVAGLAQAMSNQASINAAKSAASIGQQERANEIASASQQASLDKLEAKAADALQLYEREGEAWKRNKEEDRQEFLLKEAGANLQQANQAMYTNRAAINAGFAKAAGGVLDRATSLSGSKSLSKADKEYFQLGGTGDKFGFWLKQFFGLPTDVSGWGTEAEREQIRQNLEVDYVFSGEY